MLTLTFLGVGAAFSKRNEQSNALLEAWSIGPHAQSSPDDNLLLDFGATGPRALYALSRLPGFEYLHHHGAVNYSAIRKVFVTHLHNDHIGGMEEFAIMTRYATQARSANRSTRPELLGAAEVLTNLWERSLRGGLEAMQGHYAGLEDYFHPQSLSLTSQRWLTPFKLGGPYLAKPFTTDHVRVHNRFDWPSTGLLFVDETTQRSVLFTGDTRFDPNFFQPLIEQSLLSFHEVQLREQTEPVHTLMAELRGLPEGIRKKMLLYHFEDECDSPAYEFVANEFQGWAVPHQRYVLFE